MKTKTMNEATAANTNSEGAAVIARDPNQSTLAKLGERLAAAAVPNALGLAQHGWSPESTEALRGQIARLGELRFSKAEAQSAVNEAMHDLASVRQASWANRDRVAKGLRLLSAQRKLVVPAGFLLVNETTRNPNALHVWFKMARSYALRVRAELAVYLAADPIELIDAAMASLFKSTRAVIAARRAVKKLVVRGREVQIETKAAINSLVWVAQIAFRDDPSVLLQFRRYHRVSKATKADESKANEPEAKTEESKAA